MDPNTDPQFKDLQTQEMRKVTGTESSWTITIGLRLSQIFLIFGGVLPYIPQYIEITRTKNASGFSPYVCLAIVTACSLRVAYWFGPGYDIAIFLQSVVMIGVMFSMIELSTRVRRSLLQTERNFLDFDFKYFWAWTNLLSYIQATFVFIIFLIFIVFVFGWISGVLSVIAFAAIIVEAALALPQFLKNWEAHSTSGLNKAMVCLWAAGDMYKLMYYVLRDVPVPFVLCVIFQLILDLSILAQIFIYGDAPPAPVHYDISEFHNTDD